MFSYLKNTWLQRLLFVLGTVAVLATANITIYRNYRLQQDGRTILLALRPVDPRSIMQGDYMMLHYALQDAIDEAWRRLEYDGTPRPNVSEPARVIVSVDAQEVGTFARLDTADQAVQANEMPLRIHWSNGQSTLPSQSYFMQEGHSAQFAAAQYAIYHVAPDGHALLVGLADKNRIAIKP